MLRSSTFGHGTAAAPLGRDDPEGRDGEVARGFEEEAGLHPPLAAPDQLRGGELREVGLEDGSVATGFEFAKIRGLGTGQSFDAA